MKSVSGKVNISYYISESPDKYDTYFVVKVIILWCLQPVGERFCRVRKWRHGRRNRQFLSLPQIDQQLNSSCGRYGRYGRNVRNKDTVRERKKTWKKNWNSPSLPHNRPAALLQPWKICKIMKWRHSDIKALKKNKTFTPLYPKID